MPGGVDAFHNIPFLRIVYILGINLGMWEGRRRNPGTFSKQEFGGEHLSDLLVGT